MIEKILEKFDEKFPENLYYMKQITDCMKSNLDGDDNFKPYPQNEAIKNFICWYIKKVMKKIEVDVRDDFFGMDLIKTKEERELKLK